MLTYLTSHISFPVLEDGEKKKREEEKKEKKKRKGAIPYGNMEDHAMRCANICGEACDASTPSGTVHNVLANVM